MYDVIIIGAGASGAAIARELSRYQGRFCVLEKEADICCGTSKANSGIVHSGFDAKEGSLMAKLNVKGNKMMENLSKELDFSYKKNGSLVVCTNESEVEKLNELLERGKRNGVEGLQILDREELKALEPNISDEAVAALYAPTGGIVCPFGLTIAFAENAAQQSDSPDDYSCFHAAIVYYPQMTISLIEIKSVDDEITRKMKNCFPNYLLPICFLW